MQRNKLLGLQILRGIAAWLVVFHHINQDYFLWNPPFSFLNFINYGVIGVDIFFVLSGFIMFYSVQNNTKGGVTFLIDRFFRIFPVYWVMTLLLVLSALILPLNSYNTFYTWDSLLKSLLLIPNANPNGFGNFPFLYVGWTLTYEMFFYSVLAISLMINKKYALLIATVALCILPIRLGDEPLLGGSNILLYEFVIGVVIAYLYSLIKAGGYAKVILKPIYALPLLIILSLYSYYTVKQSGFELPVKITIAGAVVVLFLLIEETVQKMPRLGFMVSLGDVSYSTYLIHPVILGWFSLAVRSSDQQIIRFSYIFLFLFLVFFLSKLSFNYIESNKHLSALKEKLKEFYLSKFNKNNPLKNA
jgi:peptidoglycan/LPS O-acetylase OafA/YrhL